MKLVFMGTPEFAVPALDALCAAGHRIEGVFTQPDKPNGRRMKLVPTPVKKAAIRHDITVYQPDSLRRGEGAVQSLEALRRIAPDCIVVAAYGQILPKEILELPRYGCINLHASLLPKYRGAAPIQHCILAGEKESGVTIMQMAEGLDTGDMLLQGRVKITEDETADELHDELARVGAGLALEALAQLEAGTAVPVPQDDAQSCYASMIRKEMSRLDFAKPAQELHRIICALTGFTTLDGKRLKVLRSHVLPGTGDAPCGSVTDPETFTVQCGEGTLLRFDEVQLEGSRRMGSEEFLRGRKLMQGQQLVTP
ncbi:MAG: methionyl-tRNA formyltransferase [Oscillospiraceae bacterium]|nr:methionyl-tRNA formyltransferase [Oscillospiraceae bacterium]